MFHTDMSNMMYLQVGLLLLPTSTGSYKEYLGLERDFTSKKEMIGSLFYLFFALNSDLDHARSIYVFIYL